MTATTTTAIRNALDADRVVTAIVHDDRGQRLDGTITHVFDDGELAFYADDDASVRYVTARDVVEWDATN
jgi:hypothetical protein